MPKSSGESCRTKRSLTVGRDSGAGHDLHLDRPDQWDRVQEQFLVARDELAAMDLGQSQFTTRGAL